MNEPVRVSFDFTPENPDPDDATGMTAEEHEELTEALIELGAMNIKIERTA